MKKILKCAICLTALLISVVVFSACSEPDSATADHSNDKYNTEAAVKYAIEYAEKRNLDYPEFENNCTNYVSQCLVAGGLTMDNGPAPNKDTVDSYNDAPNLWYYNGKQFDSKKPPHFSISSSFLIAGDFITYWTETRGLDLKIYDNTFQGRGKMLEKTEAGSVFIYYDTEGNIVHMGLVTGKDEDSLYYSGNTADSLNQSVNELNNFVYPKFGIMEITF